VFLRWGKGFELSKRIVLAVGSCKPRNCFVAALWRMSEDAICPKDSRVIVCQLTYLVLCFNFMSVVCFEKWCGMDADAPMCARKAAGWNFHQNVKSHAA